MRAWEGRIFAGKVPKSLVRPSNKSFHLTEKGREIRTSADVCCVLCPKAYSLRRVPKDFAAFSEEAPLGDHVRARGLCGLCFSKVVSAARPQVALRNQPTVRITVGTA